MPSKLKCLKNKWMNYQSSALWIYAETICSETAKYEQVKKFTGVSLQLVCEVLQAAAEGKRSCSFSPTSQLSVDMHLCGCMTEGKHYWMLTTCKTKPESLLLNRNVLAVHFIWKIANLPITMKRPVTFEYFQIKLLKSFTVYTAKAF